MVCHIIPASNTMTGSCKTGLLFELLEPAGKKPILPYRGYGRLLLILLRISNMVVDISGLNKNIPWVYCDTEVEQEVDGKRLPRRFCLPFLSSYGPCCSSCYSIQYR